MSERRESLDSDANVKTIIQCAESGERWASWALVHRIHTALVSRKGSPSLFNYAARFFDRLLELHDQDREAPEELASAFGELHILRSQGKQKRDDQMMD